MRCLADTSDPIALVQRCAVEAGGPNWQADAMLGLAFLVVVALLAGAAWYVVRQ